MNQEQANKILEDFVKKLKPNPNNFIIIQKYNYRIYRKHRQEIFEVIKYYVECELKATIFKEYVLNNLVR